MFTSFCIFKTRELIIENFLASIFVHLHRINIKKFFLLQFIEFVLIYIRVVVFYSVSFTIFFLFLIWCNVHYFLIARQVIRRIYIIIRLINFSRITFFASFNFFFEQSFNWSFSIKQLLKSSIFLQTLLLMRTRWILS